MGRNQFLEYLSFIAIVQFMLCFIVFVLNFYSISIVFPQYLCYISTVFLLYLYLAANVNKSGSNGTELVHRISAASTQSTTLSHIALCNFLSPFTLHKRENVSKEKYKKIKDTNTRKREIKINSIRLPLTHCFLLLFKPPFHSLLHKR